MHKIKAYFDNCWGHIGVELPQEELDAPDPDLVTHFFVRGWLIWYRFGRKNAKWHLDCYAMHRMTNDRHWRVWEDGTVARLPTQREFYISARDPVENRRKEEAYYRFNRAVSELLKRKGFVLRDSKSDPEREQWRVSS